MSNAKRLDEKDPGEIIPLAWDFSCDLPETSTITGIPVIAFAVDTSLRRNTEPLPTLTLMGAPQVSGLTVLQAVAGGLDGVDYKVTCQIVPSGTPSLLLYKTSLLPVRYQ